ncbi:hypothetical protein EYC84_011209 [Monilinia fructicola]|uniref:Uncharacterized protein n=1 Tax=Monilinia fructicola TaxID=38448 RepID=A0A5M9JAB3_MONFR|nr:hypothetical protein EYC84_011209 [Monilinia fructicola]
MMFAEIGQDITPNVQRRIKYQYIYRFLWSSLFFLHGGYHHARFCTGPERRRRRPAVGSVHALSVQDERSDAIESLRVAIV